MLLSEICSTSLSWVAVIVAVIKVPSIEVDRYGCATRRSKGTCDNNATVSRQEIEARVLEGLKERLLAPELVREFVRSFQEETNRMAAEREMHYRADRLQLESVERKIAGIVAAVEAGSYSRALNDRLAELERQHEVIQARLTQRSPSTVRLHPRLAEVYADKIRDLERSLNDPEIKEEAVDVLRSLIDRIEMHPGSEGKSVDAVLYGDMAEIFALCAAHKGNLARTAVPGSQLSVVAGTRNQRCLHLDHAIL